MIKNKVFVVSRFDETKTKVQEFCQKNTLKYEESPTIDLNEDFIWIIDESIWEEYQEKNPMEVMPWSFILLTEGKENLSRNLVHYQNFSVLHYFIKYPSFLRYKRVLVLDDDIYQLRLIKKILRNIGLLPYCILKPASLEKALTIKPSLILLDLYMEDRKIDDICLEIKRHPDYSETPIVFLSASEKRDDVVGALENGANDFIKKPFFFEELIARVGVQLRIQYMYDEIKSFLINQEGLSKKLLDLLEESRLQKEQIERMNKLLKVKSITDPLTEIYNRGYLFNVLHREIERVKRYDEDLSLIMFDIDFFKRINDTYGHMVGDEVLKIVVNTIKKRIRTSDMLSRYGGEEFVVLLTNTNKDNAQRVAEQIRDNIESMTFKTKDGDKIKLTISAGITAYQKGEELDDFFVRLDEALYAAKHNGRNCTVVK
ncbi:MAG TPA: hypothetical protein DHW82_07630 [Spirochaetia bacterium]|nr:MAG: hypothetical protein A2Y41_12990 [Spirochaetes bacterium GWB1_36_13]HCL56864.1 hypothetical protein [Spirochaetia bacterium]